MQLKKTRTQTPTLVIKTEEGNDISKMRTTSSGAGFRNRKDSKGPTGRGDEKGKPKGEEPFRFPESSRREEIDNFAVYVNYIDAEDQYVWFAYRSANKEKKSKYRGDKGGVALLWGIFLPHCNNLPEETPRKRCSQGNNMADRKGEYFTGQNPLKCHISYYGEVKMLGTCLGTFTKYVGLKTGQSYKLIMTYSPDRDPKEIIKAYVNDENIKKEKKEKIYKPCDSDLCYRINENILGWDKEEIICDFILAFTRFLKDDPGAKLQFDWFYEKNLLCPPNPEVCEPYLGNVKSMYEKTKLNYNLDKVPKTKKEVYLNHISNELKPLRQGKNCKILKDTDDTYLNEEEEYPKYKPERYESLEGREEVRFVPMSVEEFREIGDTLENEVSQEQQAIARRERKLL
jgi:hypothetical protein